MRRVMKWTMLILLCGLCLTGCNSQQKKEVELFNQKTDTTITLYNQTVDKFEGREEEFVSQLVAGEISSDLIEDTVDYSQWTELVNKNVNELISDEPLIKESSFYTALGINSVTQIFIFDYRGTAYLAEILWVDTKIDMINLEVLDS